jgi:hypothetical protein
MQNRMKAKLLAGQPAFGVSVMVPSPQVVEMVGKLGFDWVLIDCEHGGISAESVELMAMAAETGGATPIARPWTNSAEAILQVMDRGVLGVQVPHVNTAADARRAVEAVKFHPQGTRGLAAGTRPANYGFGLAMSEYVARANRETLVCVQLEEEEALRNLDQILGSTASTSSSAPPTSPSRWAIRAGATRPRSARPWTGLRRDRGRGEGLGIGRRDARRRPLPGAGRPVPLHPPHDAARERQRRLPGRRAPEGLDGPRPPHTTPRRIP